jgi:hypothetical protein
MTISFGPQQPPDDPRIFNRRQVNGTYRPLSDFFDAAVERVVDNEIRLILEDRQDEIVRRLQTELFPGHVDRDELYRELSEIEIELEKLS